MRRMTNIQRRQYLERALASFADYDETPNPGHVKERLREEWGISIPIEVVGDYQMGAITLDELELGDDGVVHETQPTR